MVEPISAARGPKFTILWGHVEDIFAGVPQTTGSISAASGDM